MAWYRCPTDRRGRRYICGSGIVGSSRHVATIGNEDLSALNRSQSLAPVAGCGESVLEIHEDVFQREFQRLGVPRSQTQVGNRVPPRLDLRCRAPAAIREVILVPASDASQRPRYQEALLSMSVATSLVMGASFATKDTLQ